MSQFVLTPSSMITCITSSSASKGNVLLKNDNNTSSGLCVRAAAAAEEPAQATKEAPKAKPTPIGPRRGTKVKILRKESYWFNGIGSVVAVDQDPNARYPVVVRFNKINFVNVSTNNYALDEIEELE